MTIKIKKKQELTVLEAFIIEELNEQKKIAPNHEAQHRIKETELHYYGPQKKDEAINGPIIIEL